MPTVVKYALRTDAGWNSMSPSEQSQYAGYFTTLSAFIAAHGSTNLVSTDQIIHLVCYNDWPTGLSDYNITWDTRATTSATNYFYIYPAQGHAYNPATPLTPNGFYFTSPLNWPYTFWFYGYIYIDNILFDHTHTVRASGWRFENGFRIRYCTWIIRAYLYNIYDAAAFLRNFGELSNNLFINLTDGNEVQAIRNVDGQAIVRNNTIVEFGRPITKANPSTYPGDDTQNNILLNQSTSVLENLIFGSYNIATTHTPAGLGSKIGIYAFHFVDAANRDYHLVSSVTPASGAGINKYDGSGTQKDIDGDLYPATGGWDMGMDLYTQPVQAPTSNPHQMII